MKKLIFILFAFVGLTACSQSRFPIPQNLGSKSTQVHVSGLLVTDSGFVLKSYVDTTAANIAQLKFNGSLIKVDSSLFLYNNNKWIKLGSNGATGPQGPIGIQGIQGATGTTASQNLQSVTNLNNVTTQPITAKTYNASSPLIFASNTDAIAANLKNGDFYYLPINNGNYILAIVVEGAVASNILLTQNGTQLLTQNNSPITTN